MNILGTIPSEDIIKHTLMDHDSLVTMPTGVGIRAAALYSNQTETFTREILNVLKIEQ